jgi:hypothetical protein
VTGDDLRDMRRQTVQDGIGDEDPSEVVGLVVERLADVVGQTGELEG